MTPPTPKDEMIVPSGYAKDHVTLAAIWIFSINILLADIRQPKKPKFCRSSEKLPFNSAAYGMSATIKASTKRLGK